MSDFVKTFIDSLTGLTGTESNQEKSAYSIKVQDKVLLLDNPAKTVSEKLAEKEIKNRTKRKKKTLSSKEKRALDIFKIDKAITHKSMLSTLHKLWVEYMSELLNGVSNKDDICSKIAKADLTGCILEVKRSLVTGNVGIKGIMIKETLNTFQIICENDKIKKIPKASNWFSFQLNGKDYILFGNQFKCRSADRITKKFKLPPTIE